MEYLPILDYLAGLHPIVKYVLLGLGALVVLGQAYVALTPSETDDAWYAKLEAIPFLGGLFKALKSFAPISRKDK